jgi:hypothetical protein
MVDLPLNHTADVRQHCVRDLALVIGLVKAWKSLCAGLIHAYPKLEILRVPDESFSSTRTDHAPWVGQAIKNIEGSAADAAASCTASSCSCSRLLKACLFFPGSLSSLDKMCHLEKQLTPVHRREISCWNFPGGYSLYLHSNPTCSGVPDLLSHSNGGRGGGSG